MWPPVSNSGKMVLGGVTASVASPTKIQLAVISSRTVANRRDFYEQMNYVRRS